MMMAFCSVSERLFQFIPEEYIRYLDDQNKIDHYFVNKVGLRLRFAVFCFALITNCTH